MAGWDPNPVEHYVTVTNTKYKHAGQYMVRKITSNVENKTIMVRIGNTPGPMQHIEWTVKLLLESVKLNMYRQPYQISAEGIGPTRSAAEDAAFFKLFYEGPE